MPSSKDPVEEARDMLRAFGVQEPPGNLVLRGDSIWLTTAEDWPEGLRVHALGIRLFRIQSHGLKPTSFGLQALGPLIRARRVEVSRPELRSLLLGRALPKPDLPQGYVALCLDGEVIGCGEARDGRLRCHIPLGRRQELLVVITHEEHATSPYNEGERGELGDPRGCPEGGDSP